jgi:hypothetical protein
MPCLFALFAGFFPRVADLLLWIARPTQFMAPFNGNYLWPILGVVFLPFTTLFYVILWRPGVGITGLDWLWIGMAVFFDLTSLAGHFQKYREQQAGKVTSQPAA